MTMKDSAHLSLKKEPVNSSLRQKWQKFGLWQEWQLFVCGTCSVTSHHDCHGPLEMYITYPFMQFIQKDDLVGGFKPSEKY